MIDRTSKNFGFTLIELMVVIVIAAILLTIAVPSFDNLIKRNNVDSLQSKLSSALSTARTEAASRNRIITICRSTDQANCVTDAAASNFPWSNGWIIFEDNDGDGVVETASGDILIDVYRNTGGYTIRSTANRISFNSQGFSTDGANTLMTICEPKKDLVYARGLFVNRSGLVMKTRDGTDADNVHDDPTSTSGGDLTCP